MISARMLTSKAVEAARPRRNAAGEAVRTEIPDRGCTGLYLIIQPTGARSWALRCRDTNGRSRKITLGNGDLTLSAARAAAAEARHRVEQGDAPVPVTPGAGDAIEVAVADFITRYCERKGLRTAAVVERTFERLVLPRWRGRSVKDIRRADVIKLIEEVAETCGPFMANRLQQSLSRLFNWLIARDVVTASPVAGVEKVAREIPRDKVLTDSEVLALWRASEQEQDSFGPAFRFAMLTGARRNEVSEMTWDEVDPETRIWRLPRERSKNGLAHSLPLSTQAWAIIEGQPCLGPYVFPGRNGGRLGNWARPKARMSERSGIAESSWRLHDLRRTCASGMQRLGAKVEVIERALNHKSFFRGVSATYLRHDYHNEIGEALQAWGDCVECLVAVDKVVELKKRKRK